MLIDSHTHIQFPEFDADRDAVVRRALEAGVWMVNVGTNVESSKKAVELAHKYPEGVYATVGIHPHDVDAEYDFAQIEELARDPKVVGIGEAGLDYFRITNQESRIKEKQKELFVKHIELARKVKKPLIIHCREAHDDLLGILQSRQVNLGRSDLQQPTNKSTPMSNPKTNNSSGDIKSADGGQTSRQAEVEARGVMHFFGGEGAWENLDEYLKMGFYISLAGVITFKNYKDIEKVKKMPLDRILIETDAPYVAPEPYRGKRNEPLYVKYVAEKLAEIFEADYDELSKQTTINAKKLFRFV